METKKMQNEAEHIARLKISKIVDNENGTSTLHFDLDKDFIDWFKKREGLKRFSHRRFQKFISHTLSGDSSEVSGTIIVEKE
jgi:hypothetical protein